MVDSAGMEQPSLYQRIGGAAGVEAVVRTLHQCVQGDPNTFAEVEKLRFPDMVRDAQALARVLDGLDDDDDDGIASWRFGVLLSRPGVSVRHLRDALWLLGMSSELIDEVTAAVVEVTVAA
jgi:hypothetical protein